MAYYDDSDEQQKDPNAPKAGTGGQQLAGGESGTLDASSPSSSNPSSNATTPASSGPTASPFVGIQQYIDANKGQTKQLADNISSEANAEGNQARGAVAAAGTTFGDSVNLGSRGTSYTGPGSFETSTAYQPAKSAVDTAVQTAQGLGTQEGQRGLISNVQRNKTGSVNQGALDLDSALISSDPDARASLLKTGQGLADIPGAFQKLSDSANQQVIGGKALANQHSLDQIAADKKAADQLAADKAAAAQKVKDQQARDLQLTQANAAAVAKTNAAAAKVAADKKAKDDAAAAAAKAAADKVKAAEKTGVGTANAKAGLTPAGSTGALDPAYNGAVNVDQNGNAVQKQGLMEGLGKGASNVGKEIKNAVTATPQAISNVGREISNGVKKVRDSFICTELLYQGLITDLEFRKIHKMQVKSFLRRGRFASWYIDNGPRLVDLANLHGFDWSQAKVWFFDDVLARETQEDKEDYYGLACERLCRALAPELWDERVMRNSRLDSLIFLPKVLWFKPHREMLLRQGVRAVKLRKKLLRAN